MSSQIWLQCPRKDVQELKSWLGESLRRDEKVKKSDSHDGLMLIPTTFDYKTQLEQLELPTGVKAGDVVLVPIQSEAQVPLLGAIEAAIQIWLKSIVSSHSQLNSISVPDLISQAPKRWSVYQPMVLLPSGSFSTPQWSTLLSTSSGEQKHSLWSLVLNEISKKDGGGQLTHLAINSGIPLSGENDNKDENILRSPSGLIMLHGDFGPSLPPTQEPTAEDFNAAFWVSTKQNGIYQTWAPRYTMFSRGNIKEKARLLSFHNKRNDDVDLKRSSAVDLYAGIGYFVFSYAYIDMKAVWCWEINPWSVEGLRRGAIKNGWKVKIVKARDSEQPIGDLVANIKLNGATIVVFEESNDRAEIRLLELRAMEDARVFGEVRHVNCGFLPSSEPSWKAAFAALDQRKGGWLHLHENVAVADIEARKTEIETMIKTWAEKDKGLSVKVDHVEQVKTFAPGVWHCVFDVHVQRLE